MDIFSDHIKTLPTQLFLNPESFVETIFLFIRLISKFRSPLFC